MGIPLAKSRRIVVDGRPFRWLNHGNKSRYLGDCTGMICVIAQEEKPQPGRPMRAWLRCKELDVHPEYVEDPENHHGLPKFAFKPSDVAAVIRRALACGWDPSSRGGVFDVIAPLQLPTWYVISS